MLGSIVDRGSHVARLSELRPAVAIVKSLWEMVVASDIKSTTSWPWFTTIRPGLCTTVSDSTNARRAV